MTKTYRIEVDCAACALKMENAAKKTDGVAGANVNFMTQKMSVDFAEGCDHRHVMESVRRNCKRAESDCEVYLS